MNIFNSDGWFSRFFGTLGDIIIVNILFILCSIPIVTMGASMSAMYFTLLKKQRTGENGGVVKLFFKGFKDNFKQSTISWLLFLLISFIFTLDFNLFGKGGPQELIIFGEDFPHATQGGFFLLAPEHILAFPDTEQCE